MKTYLWNHRSFISSTEGLWLFFQYLYFLSRNCSCWLFHCLWCYLYLLGGGGGGEGGGSIWVTYGWGYLPWGLVKWSKMARRWTEFTCPLSMPYLIPICCEIVGVALLVLLSVCDFEFLPLYILPCRVTRQPSFNIYTCFLCGWKTKRERLLWSENAKTLSWSTGAKTKQKWL